MLSQDVIYTTTHPHPHLLITSSMLSHDSIGNTFANPQQQLCHRAITTSSSQSQSHSGEHNRDHPMMQLLLLWDRGTCSTDRVILTAHPNPHIKHCSHLPSNWGGGLPPGIDDQTSPMRSSGICSAIIGLHA